MRFNDFLDFHSARVLRAHKKVLRQRKHGDRDPRIWIERFIRYACAELQHRPSICNFECNEMALRYGFRVMPLSQPCTLWTFASFYHELDEKLFGNFFRIVWFFSTAMHLQLLVKVIVDNRRWVLGKAFLMFCPRALFYSAFQSQDTNAL